MLAALATLTAVPASAVTILEYGTAGSTTAMAPTVEAAGVTGTDFTAGPGLTVQSFSTFNFTAWDVASTSAADAFAAGDFWEWGFTSTQAYDLSTFDIRLDRSGTGPDDFVIQLSVNGGSFGNVLSHDYNDATTGVDFLGNNLSLSGVMSATFRLMAFNSESSVGTFDLEALTGSGSGGAFVLSGDLSAPAVPLPAGLPLALTGFGVLAFLRRLRG